MESKLCLFEGFNMLWSLPCDTRSQAWDVDFDHNIVALARNKTIHIYSLRGSLCGTIIQETDVNHVKLFSGASALFCTHRTGTEIYTLSYQEKETKTSDVLQALDSSFWQAVKMHGQRLEKHASKKWRIDWNTKGNYTAKKILRSITVSGDLPLPVRLAVCSEAFFEKLQFEENEGDGNFLPEVILDAAVMPPAYHAVQIPASLRAACVITPVQIRCAGEARVLLEVIELSALDTITSPINCHLCCLGKEISLIRKDSIAAWNRLMPAFIRRVDFSSDLGILTVLAGFTLYVMRQSTGEIMYRYPAKDMLSFASIKGGKLLICKKTSIVIVSEKGNLLKELEFDIGRNAPLYYGARIASTGEVFAVLPTAEQKPSTIYILDAQGELLSHADVEDVRVAFGIDTISRTLYHADMCSVSGLQF